MSNDMQAIVYYGPGNIGFEQRRIASVGPTDARVRITYNGLCTTDYEIVAGRIEGTVPGMIIGHEPVGIVEEVGFGVTEVEPGDRIVLDTMLGCGICEQCRSGHTELCRDSDEIGFSIDGCWSDFGVFPAKNLHIVPEKIEDIDATLIEALTCEMGGVDALDIRMGDDVLIIGSGLAMLIFVQLARLRGAGFIAVGMYDYRERIELAQRFGADVVYTKDPRRESSSSAAMRRRNGFDAVLDAVCTPETVGLSVDLTKRGGSILLYGLRSATLDHFPMAEVIFKNLTLYGRTSAPQMWRRAIDLVAQGDIELAPLVGEVITFEDVVPLFRSPRERGGVIKRVIRFV
jgi:threonine dehydrogenase-like Zn-dependent dehydrogenase